MSLNTFEDVQEFLPFLIPLIVLQLALMLTALVMLIKQDQVRYLNKLVWGIIILFISLLGPILYFVLERRA